MSDQVKDGVGPQEPQLITWEFLKNVFFEDLKTEGKEKQKRNFNTAINTWLAALGLAEDSVVGAELSEEFEAKIKIYIEFEVRRKISRSTYGPRVSKLRRVKAFVSKRFAPTLVLQNLPKAFGQRLRALITAMGFTIHSFWRSLPQGLAPYDTLWRWCRGSIPSRENLHVLSVIESQLRVPDGTLLTTKYLRSNPNENAGQSDYGNKMRAALSKPYYIWNEALRQEFEGLLTHKTVAILPDGEERSDEGQWTRNEELKVPSAELAEGSLRSFMGYCGLPAGNPDPYLRGAGIEPKSLSLALLADKRLVENFVEFRKLRSGLRVRPLDRSTLASLQPYEISANGLWQFYGVKGKYNSGSLSFLSFVSSLLRPGTGYLYQHPEVAERLKAGISPADWRKQCRDTRARVNKLHKRILKMKKRNDVENFDYGRNPNESIQWILDQERPLFIIQQMIKDMLNDLLPEDAPIADRARQMRDIVLIALLCSNPLRIYMFSIMKFGKNLARESDGSWWLKFNRGQFKNRRSLKSNYRVQVARELWPLLDLYQKVFHPVLVSATKSKHVFVSAGRCKDAHGAPMQPRSLSEVVGKLTALYIPDTFGFRAHAFRHIVATDIIKKDPRLGFFLASVALHDKLETVEESYQHLKTSEFFAPVNTHFGESWRVVFGPSYEIPGAGNTHQAHAA